MCASYDGSPGDWRRGRGGGWRGGRGGGRGGRGRGGGGWKTHNRYYQDDSDNSERWDQQSGRGYGRDRFTDTDDNSRGRKRGHPAGLKGREIGLYYARKGMRKNNEREKRERPNVNMDAEKEKHLTSLLENIRKADDKPVTAQPRRSYQALSDDEEFEGSWDSTAKQPEASQGSASLDTMDYDSWENRNIDMEETPKESSQNIAPNMSPTHSPTDDILNAQFISLETPQTVESSSSKAGPSSIPGGNCDYPACSGVRSNQEGEEDMSDFSDIDEDLASQLAEEAGARSMAEQSPDTSHSGRDDEEGQPVTSQMSELLQYEREEMSEFMDEFNAHTKANRRSNEKLSETPRFLPLERKPALDTLLMDDMMEKKSDANFKKMLQFRKKLPSFSMREKVLDMISSNQVTVISGETGCGKTTQVTQFILDDFIEKGNGSQCRIICTQPRRISAISVAERVAQERAERCGQGSVGFQIRLEKKLPREQGSILYCTTGIMLRWLASDPMLSKISHVILDEIHERDLQSDFLMIILKDLIKKRTDLKLILMSATLNAAQFSEYFYNSPMINIPGYTFPVKEYVLEDILDMTRYKLSGDFMPKRRKRIYGEKKHEAQQEEMKFGNWLSKIRHDYHPDTLDYLKNMDPQEIDVKLIAHIVDYIVRSKPEGAILVFVPGWDQISKVNTLLEKNPLYSSGRMKVIPLHSLMPTVNQKEIFNRPPPGVRKVVVATNIAETSITIEDVVYVIDCGKIKMKQFDAENNMGTLQAEWVSRANAKQRRGRAGRVQSGECYHLYTKYHEARFADYQLPEMLRTRLEELCLQIKLLKLGRIEPFVSKAMQPPSMEALKLSVDLLMQLNALDHNEELTPLGYHLAKMPMNPHTGKMLLFGAMFSCLDPILTIAASLSFKDAFYIPLGKEKQADMRRKDISKGSKSDHIMLANAFQGWERAKAKGRAQQYCWDNFLSEYTLKLLKDMRKQFAELLYEMKFIDSAHPNCPSANLNSGNHKVIKAAVCAGLYPNVAKMKKPKRDPVLITKTDRRVKLHPKSVNVTEDQFESPWLIYHLKMKTSSVYLYDCSLVSPYPLLFFGGDITVRKDDGRDSVVVDDWIMFWSTKKIAHLVMELRKELDKLLEYKITHPSSTDWNPKQKEGALMHAIIDLISTEEHKIHSAPKRDWKDQLKHDYW